MTAPQINLTIDMTDISKALNDAAYEQLPFATSRALNSLAFEIRENQVQGMRDRFTIRRDWILGGFRVRKSNKHDDPISVTIGIEDQDRRAWMLGKFEKGGRLNPGDTRARGIDATRGYPYIAVPAPALKRFGVVPKTMYPSAYKIFPGRTKGLNRAFGIYEGKLKGIWIRIGKGKHDTIRLYTFKDSIAIPPILKFQVTAETTIAYRYQEIFAQELANALQSSVGYQSWSRNSTTQGRGGA